MSADIHEPDLERLLELVAERSANPRATYRLQFERGRLGFREAAELVPYLADLGISHLYGSPILAAQPGSAHGYDIVDHDRLDSALGSEDDFRALVARLREHGLGLIVDIVPNHMGIAAGNARWNDVLENGPSSPYAGWFDVDWRPQKSELRNRVLLPLLGDQYGRVLEAGEVRVEFEEGAFFVRYFDTRLPTDPKTYALVLEHGIDELRARLDEEDPSRLEFESIITALDYLPNRTETEPERVAERQREKEVVKRRLRRLVEESSAIAEFVEKNVAELNGDPAEPESFALLDVFLTAQPYRLAHWKAASDEINYRRFFDVNELAAICTEDPAVFEESHQFVFELLARGDVDGLRIDHIDGLFDPRDYAWRLQWGYLRELGRRALGLEDDREHPGEPTEPGFLQPLWDRLNGPAPEPALDGGAHWQAEWTPAAHRDGRVDSARVDFTGGRLPLYVLVEKILEPHEWLPTWPVSGTTGYDFLNLVGGVLLDPAHLDVVHQNYARFTGRWNDFGDVAYRCKRLILDVAMASELQLLASRLNRLSEQHRHTRDYTLNNLRRAIREILACFPVYRTYLLDGPVSERDRRYLARAVAGAKWHNPAMQTSLFDFVRDTLLFEQPPEPDARAQVVRRFFVGRFQQASSAVMAKSVEDTAFYREFPLTSVNEVGRSPVHPTISTPDFHAENRERLRRHPGSLVCTTTHDTKRSEDVRARISVLAEVPELWDRAVQRWADLNDSLRTEVDGEPAPTRNDEYLFYQSLVGTAPIDANDEQAWSGLLERLTAYLEKATHEAKERTSWTNPNPDYDAAVRSFVERAMSPGPDNRFLNEVRAFNEKVLDAGLYAALSQVFLKLAAPGVPDVYQGQELWDFSLVDPDNRRPVDFDRRRWLAEEVRAALADPDSLIELATHLGSHPRDDRTKLLVTWSMLRFRAEHEDLVARGRCLPLESSGSRAEHVCAFGWSEAEDEPPTVVAIAPRWPATLLAGESDENPSRPPLEEAVWQDTTVQLGAAGESRFGNLFTGAECTATDGGIRLADALSVFPVALLVAKKP